MKIAVAYNEPRTAEVMQRRGPVAREVYSARGVERIREALEQLGHEVVGMECDRHIIDRLERFFGPVSDPAFPGLVFNLAYGIQGQLRYCHLPGLLEMLGLPYLGSGPLGHALASDKAATKTLCAKRGLATPGFALYQGTVNEDPGLGFPLVVKPVAQAQSLGVKLVHDLAELRSAVRENLEEFHEPVMAEQFIAGREINVSVLGNEPGTALTPVEVVIGAGGLPVYTHEDKWGMAVREHRLVCPADLPVDLTRAAQRLAVEAFRALSCRDWARVEFRIDDDGVLQLLEVNTIPGLGQLSSLPTAAREAGLADLPALLGRLVDIAVTRYAMQPSVPRSWPEPVLS